MIDLHLHTQVSDGTDTPEELVQQAATAGAELIAITDHDALDGFTQTRALGEQLGLQIIPGVEFSCFSSRRNIHVIGYFPSGDNEELLGELRKQQDIRTARNLRLVEELRSRSLDITIEDVLKHGTGPSVGRPHFAAALLEKGYVFSVDEAFRRYLSNARSGVAKKRGIEAKDTIALIKRAGGVAVWAHPYIGGEIADDLRPDLDELIGYGLDGIECWYGSFPPSMRTRLAEIAKANNLLATGGSDYHGTYKPGLFIGTGRGDLQVPRECGEQLLAMLGI